MSILGNQWAQQGRSVSIVILDEGTGEFYPLDPGIRRVALAITGHSPNRLAGAIRNIGRILAIRKAIRNLGPQLIVSFLTETNVLVLLATLGMRTPVIATEHTVPGFAPLRGIWALLRRLTYRTAFRIALLSQNAAADFPKEWQPRIRIIPNPVVPASPTNSPAPGKETYHLVSVARLAPEKNLELLITAFGRIADGHPDWTLTIHGEGPQRGQLERLVRSLGLESRISLPGRSRDIGAKLSQADLFALSSDFEAFPMAVCEALAARLAVICTDCPGGIREIIRNEVDGILVPPRDTDGFASALDRLMGDSAERERLARNAEEIVERFGLERVMGLWEEMFRSAHEAGLLADSGPDSTT